jgi:ADP-ribose pyrophosphatase YjhB (NUDIX family)
MSERPDRTKAGEAAERPSGPSVRMTPPGDDRERLVCADCGFVHYENPKVVVGSVAVWEERVLLVRRAIAPRKGYWGLPAGYLELNETTAEGAAREAWEEARARLEIGPLFALYNIPRISQVQVYYQARLTSPEVAAGPESLEVALFAWDDIPYETLAFPSVRWALDHYREVEAEEGFAVRTNPPGEDGNMWRRG